MRVPSGSLNSAKPVTYLWERHKEVARLLLAGQRPIDIAKRLGYTPAWLSTMMNSPVFKDYMAKLSATKDDRAMDIREQIREGAQVGVSELLKIIKGEDEYAEGVSVQQKIKVAQDFLDREGHGKVTKVEQRSVSVVLNEDRISLLKERRAALLANLSLPVSPEGRTGLVCPAGRQCESEGQTVQHSQCVQSTQVIEGELL